MNKVLAVTLIGFLLLAARPASAEIIDRVVAVVSGQIITKSDVEAARALGLVDDGLQSLIDRILMLNEVRRVSPTEPSAGDVDRRVAAIRSRFASASALEQALAASGINDQVLRIYAEDDLSLAGYLDERFSDASQPTEEEVRQAGEASRAKLAAERRQTLIAAWVGELRRRADITVLAE
jgi:hypothetical protein